MVGKNLHLLRVEVDLVDATYVDLSKVGSVEVALQHVAALQDIVVFQSAFCTYAVPSTVQLLILLADGLSLILVLLLHIGQVLVEVSHLRVKLVDTDILRLKLVTQLIYFSVLLVHLSSQVFDGTLQLLTGTTTLAQLITQFLNELSVLCQGLLYVPHVLTNALSGVVTLTSAVNREPALRLVNFTEALLYLVERREELVLLVAQLLVLLQQYLNRVIVLRRAATTTALLVTTATHHSGQQYVKKNFLHNQNELKNGCKVKQSCLYAQVFHFFLQHIITTAQ